MMKTLLTAYRVGDLDRSVAFYAKVGFREIGRAMFDNGTTRVMLNLPGDGDVATIELSLSQLREVAGYAVACARPALAIFERERPDDRRPRAAIDAAQAFADGAKRTKVMRDGAWAAMRAAQEARDAGQAAASDAARAAVGACSAGYLHPLARAAQVKHILGSAAHAARPCPSLVNCVTRPRVRRLRRLEEVEDVLRARCRPQGEEVMIRIGERPTAADRHETRVAVFREDHRQHPFCSHLPN